MDYTVTSIGIRSDPPELFKEITKRWQQFLDLLSRILDIPAALVMRVLQKEIEVFARSDSEGNPYHSGERADLAWPDGEMFGTLCVLDSKERI